MAATSAQLREVGLPYRFTPQNARAAAEKSVAARRARKLSLSVWTQFDSVAESAPAPSEPQQPASPAPQRLDPISQRQIEMLREELARTRRLLADTKHQFCKKCQRGGIHPRDRAQLQRSLSELFDVERRILGLSGTRRDKREPAGRRGRGVSSALEPLGHEPIEPAVAPVEVAPISSTTSSQTNLEQIIKPAIDPGLESLLCQIGA